MVNHSIRVPYPYGHPFTIGELICHEDIGSEKPLSGTIVPVLVGFCRTISPRICGRWHHHYRFRYRLWLFSRFRFFNRLRLRSHHFRLFGRFRFGLKFLLRSRLKSRFRGRFRPLRFPSRFVHKSHLTRVSDCKRNALRKQVHVLDQDAFALAGFDVRFGFLHRRFRLSSFLRFFHRRLRLYRLFVTVFCHGYFPLFIIFDSWQTATQIFKLLSSLYHTYSKLSIIT